MRRYHYGKVTLAAATLAILTAGVVSATGPAWAAFPGTNGKIAFTSDRNMGEGVVNPESDDEIFAMNPDGSEVEQLTVNVDEDTDPEYSADGGQIVFVREGRIYKMNADGTGEVPLTPPSENSKDYEPVWSPSGEHIAFQRFQNRAGEIFKIRSDGSDPENLTRNPRDDSDPAWSPGGKKIAFTRKGQGNDLDIYKMSVNGSRQVQVTKTETNDFQPDFSPDGQRIVFVRGPGSGEPNIYKMMADGTKQTALTRPNDLDDTNPAWSPDGKKIVYMSEDQISADTDIFKMDASDGSKKTDISRVAEDQAIPRPDWQPIP